MVQTKITIIDRPTNDPKKFKIPNLQQNTMKRTQITLPQSLHLPKYKHVHFFTKNHNS